MIISDNVPPSPAKSNAALSNLQSPFESPPPPTYGAAVGRLLPPPPQQYQPHVGSSSSSRSDIPRSHLNGPADLEATTSRRSPSPGRRFCQAFAVALLISVLAASFLGNSMMSYRTKRGWHSDFAIPNNVAVISCTKGSEMQNNNISWSSPYSSSEFSFDPSIDTNFAQKSTSTSNKLSYGSVQTSLSLPLSSDTLFLLSRGLSSTGSLRIEPSSDLEEGIARVDVRISYTNFAKQRDSLSQASVCLIQRKPKKGKQVGVGLFSSRQSSSSTSPYPHSSLTYDVTLVLPESLGPSVLRLNAFETDLPNFHHFFTRSLDDFVTFGRLVLKAGNGIISAASLTADNATIHTSNREINIKSLTSNAASLYTMSSEIRGHFVTYQSLNIKALNTKVKADIELLSQDPKGGGSIVIQTTQKALEATINIHDPSYYFNSTSTSSDPSSTYFLSTSNKNGVVDVDVPLLPLDSSLNLTASSTNGRVTTTLPASYEGSYSVLTTKIRGEVHLEHTEDPTGLERKRVLTRGSVYWDESNQGKGAVVLKSVNGQAELFL